MLAQLSIGEPPRWELTLHQLWLLHSTSLRLPFWQALGTAEEYSTATSTSKIVLQTVIKQRQGLLMLQIRSLRPLHHPCPSWPQYILNSQLTIELGLVVLPKPTGRYLLLYVVEVVVPVCIIIAVRVGIEV